MSKPQKQDFSVKLTRSSNPRVGRALSWRPWKTLRFMGHMRPWRQTRPHWEYAAELLLVAATTGEEADIERATAQMERALRTENWL